MSNIQKNNKPNVPNLRFPEFSGEWMSCQLGKIASLSKGEGISKDQRSINGNPCILYGELYTTYSTEIIDKVISKTNLPEKGLVKSKANDVIIPASGETAIDISTARCVTRSDVFLGGDLNIIRLKGQDGKFFSYQLNGVRKKDIAKVAQGVSIVHLHGSDLATVQVNYPSIGEQQKISGFLSLIDQRIAIQNRIIEDLKKLRTTLCELMFNQSAPNYRLGDIIEQVSVRNKDEDSLPILSVNNQLGFIEQSEQFENRIVASEDTSNYKIVFINDFAFNPARINVGSIARLKKIEKGIVSPMYICFRIKHGILPEYLEPFFRTKFFHTEMDKRLEGSVRMCLSFEGLCNIPIYIPAVKEQSHAAQRILKLNEIIEIEQSILNNHLARKNYLLGKMLI